VIERVRRLDAREAALVAFAVAGAAAFAWGRAEPRAWLLLLPFSAATAFRITGVPAALRGAFEKVAWLATGLLAGAVFYWLASPEGLGQPVPPLPAAAAYGAPLLSAIFLAGRSVWPPSRALVPAVLVTTVVGASQARTARAMEVAIAAVALGAALILLSDQRPGPASARRRRLVRFVPFALLIGLVGAGIAWALPRAQPQVVQAAARAAFPQATSRFSPEARLGGTEELALSPEVAMRVWTERPQKLRAWVATRFDGTTWLRTPGAVRRVLAAPSMPQGELATWLAEVPGETFLVASPESEAPLGSPLERLRVLLVGSIPGSIPAPRGLLVARVRTERLGIDPSGLLSPALAPDSLYSMLSGTPGPEPAPGADLVALPGDMDPRLVALSQSLGAGAVTSEERVDRTLDYLQTHLRYSLRVGRFRSRHFVAEFVFEKKQGWCQYFATTAAVLLRLQGVPTRYVSGFQLRPQLLRGGHYVVRQADAHAWIEAWLPGRGWVEADPTPAAGYDRAHGEPGGGWLQEAWHWLCGLGGLLLAVDWKAVPGLLWAEAVALAGRAPARIGLSAAAVLLMASIAVWMIRSLRATRTRHRVASTSSGGGSELAPLLARLDGLWAEHGVPRPPSHAPLEHLNQMPAGRAPAPLIEVSRQIVDRYYRARFAGEAAGSDEVRALESALEDRIRP
jgi:transglutaminase-like putative cysteine protease